MDSNKTSETPSRAESAPAYCSGIGLARLLESIPVSARKKMSLAEIHDIAKNYNGGVVVQALSPDTHSTMVMKLRWLSDDAALANMMPLAQTLAEMASEVEAGA